MILSYLNIGIGAALGAVLVAMAGSAYDNLVDDPNVRRAERAQVEIEARERAMELMKDRADDNAELTTFDLRQLCVEFGGRWVQPNGPCN